MPSPSLENEISQNLRTIQVSSSFLSSFRSILCASSAPISAPVAQPGMVGPQGTQLLHQGPGAQASQLRAADLHSLADQDATLSHHLEAPAGPLGPGARCLGGARLGESIGESYDP